VRNYNSSKHIVNFPNGSKLQFGHCQHEKDVRNYQGAEYLFIGFDELTEFTYGMWNSHHRNRCLLKEQLLVWRRNDPGGVDTNGSKVSGLRASQRRELIPLVTKLKDTLSRRPNK